MIQTMFRSLKMTIILAVIFCGLYPAVVYLFGRVLFPAASTGSLIERGGKTVGSRLIGQSFSKPEYFHGRPSSAGDKGYDAANSSGSNLGPTSEKLRKAVEANVKKTLEENPTLKKGEVPVDLVTSSASGLDPHVSPQGALVQAERVSKARGVNLATIEGLVQAQVEKRQLGMLGEPVINVLELNLALDEKFPVKN